MILRQSNKEFLKLVSNDIKHYREWCESSLNKKINPATLNNVKSFCIPRPYKTAVEKLENEGFQRLTKEQLGQKYKEIKPEELVSHPLIKDIFKDKDLNELIKANNLQKEFEDAYLAWCDTEANKSLAEKDFYPLGYSRFRSRCADIESLRKVWRQIEKIKKENPIVQDISDFEKKNECNIYFVNEIEKNYAFRAEDPKWAEIQIRTDHRKRQLYEEFKEFIASDRAEELCKESKGGRILVRYDYWKSRWVV